MERKSYGGPIARTVVGGILIFCAFLFFIYAVVFSIIGHELETAGIVFWVFTFILLAIGIPLLCTGISGIKETKRHNGSLGNSHVATEYTGYQQQTYTQPQTDNSDKPVFCPYCGNRYAEDAGFCSHCGSPREQQ